MHPVIPILLLAACATDPLPEPVAADEAPTSSDASMPGDRGATSIDALEADLPEGIDPIAIRADEIAWGPCPPGPLQAIDCRMAVLEGAPRAQTLFTFRVDAQEPFVLAPHTHPRHERVTVLAGAVHVGFGERVDEASGQRFEAGDFYVNRAGAAHYVWSDEPVTLQLTGIGPWEIHPVEATAAAE